MSSNAIQGGEGSPILTESNESQLHSSYTGYKYFANTLRYTHEDALVAIGITQQQLDQLLVMFERPTDTHASQ